MNYVKEAKLILNGNSIYIDGDLSRSDLLKSIKYHRRKNEKKLESLENNDILTKYLELEKERKRILKEYALPSEIMAKVRRDIYNGSPLTLRTTVVNGIEIPRAKTFAKDTLLNIEVKIEKIKAEIDVCDQKVSEVTPTFMEKLFAKKKFERRLEEAKNSVKEKKNNLQEELDDMLNLYMSVESMNKNIIEPFFSKDEDLFITLHEALTAHNDIDSLLSSLESTKRKLADCNCYPYEEKDVYHIIPKKAKEYLDENNLIISIDSFVNKVMEAQNIDEKIKKELLNIFPKNTKDYKKEFKNNNKNIK